MNDDTEQEERQRYRELLEELRTIITGADVLFAFLLTVPFSSRFAELDNLGKIVFAISLMSIAAATILFLAPASYHRLVGHRDRPRRLRFGVRTALVGLALLALSVTCAIFVVVRFVFGSMGLGIAMSATAAALVIAMWYLLPLQRRQHPDAAAETRHEP